MGRGGSVCTRSPRGFSCHPRRHWRSDHVYTTIQLPRNGCRRLSHQSPSLGPARPGPAAPNKTIKTTTATTTQSSSFNALTVTSACDSTGGVPNPGAAGDALIPRGHRPPGSARGTGAAPPPCPPGSARQDLLQHFIADIIFYCHIKSKLRWLYGAACGTSALPAAPSALLGTALSPCRCTGVTACPPTPHGGDMAGATPGSQMVPLHHTSGTSLIPTHGGHRRPHHP